MAAHKWAAEMHAFADGGSIQSSREGGAWLDDDRPDFCEPRLAFRVRPAAPEREVVETMMTGDQLLEYFIGSGKTGDAESIVFAVNKAIEHALDAGQVVTCEEFDRMCGDRKARDMAVARAVELAMHHAAHAAPGRADFGIPAFVAWDIVDLDSIVAGVK